ncbi:MAG: hypothetical protein NT029_07045 [Armatimonadetes bacterium]|nr:hypothetical protein [Armatimonadota bacterium]
MTVEERIRQIEEQLVGSQPKQVLLVEGTNDVEAYRLLLERHRPSSAGSVAVAEAGGKREVCQILKARPGWVGLLDHDEWGDARAQAALTKHPNLRLLPRYCLESYLIHPGELWRALPPAQQSRIQGGDETLASALLNDLDRYLRHGALWHTVRPLWDVLMDLDFTNALASARSVDAAQNDDAIKATLAGWQAALDPDSAFGAFQRNLASAQAAPLDEQLANWVHGKVFFNQHVCAALNKHLGQRGAEKRRTELLRSLPIAPDLAALFEDVLALAR